MMMSLVLLLTGFDLCAAAPRYPLKLSSNHRYLVDQDNRPFFLNGDAAWSLLSALTKDEAARYLENRRALGFNTLIVNLVEHHFNGPANRAGDEPFTTPGDFSTPNEKYFAHADWVLHRANEKGLLILLAPCYLGYKGLQEGWYDEIRASGIQKCRVYGRFVGERYHDLPNIIWVMGGDRDPGDALEEVREIARGIKEYDQRNLFTAHCAPEESAADGYGGESWLDVNTTYSYAIVHQKLMADYRRQPPRPDFMIESTYEGEHNSTAVQIRRQAYWAPLCGAFGHVMGNKPIWLFDPGWEAALRGTASLDMARFAALFRSRAWYDLVPDEAHKIVTAGLGEENGLDYATAARTSDGATAIIYLPTARPITVGKAVVTGAQARAWWFDPRNGQAHDAGLFATDAAHEFIPPAGGDWVLVLDDAGKNFPAPGTSPAP
jgi:hypothetical protein